jgi:hypothetical protein
MLASAIVGFGIGRNTAPKQPGPQHATLGGCAVDCYDSNGKLVPDPWGEKFGGVRLDCPAGQTPKLHQSVAH